MLFRSVVVQISRLLKLGRPRKLLEDALLLLREVPWTTKASEQSHASLTAVHRHHPEASAEQVALRAGLHAARHLFHKTPDPKKEQALHSRVVKARRSSTTPMRFAKSLWRLQWHIGLGLAPCPPTLREKL